MANNTNELNIENGNILVTLDNILSDLPNRLNWKEYFMSMALLASQRSSCSRLKVGCVIVSDNRVICMGYNGFLPNSPHVSRIRDNHEQATVHAEQNSISDAAARGASVRNSTAYITHFPCINCFKTLVSAHIKIIYYHTDYHNDNLVKEMAIESGVKIIKL